MNKNIVNKASVAALSDKIDGWRRPNSPGMFSASSGPKSRTAKSPTKTKTLKDSKQKFFKMYLKETSQKPIEKRSKKNELSME